jgi:hypothetical protein
LPKRKTMMMTPRTTTMAWRMRRMRKPIMRAAEEAEEDGNSPG